MPIYEYVCNECGRVSEILVKSSQTDKPQCRHCKSRDLNRMLSGFAVGKSKQSQDAAGCEGQCATGNCPFG